MLTPLTYSGTASGALAEVDRLLARVSMVPPLGPKWGSADDGEDGALMRRIKEKKAETAC